MESMVKFNLRLESIMKGLKVFILLLVFMVAVGCTQTKSFTMVWNKNAESDVKHYDLFIVVLADSNAFYTLIEWPVSMLDTVRMDSLIHIPNLLATMGHITSPIDTMLFQWDQPMSDAYLRGYILAADLYGNTSPMAPSVNIVYLGDRIAPEMPKQYYLRFPEE